MNFNQHVKRICIPEDRDNSVLKITSTEIENSEVDDETGETLVEYKALWRKPITVSFDPNGAEGSVPDVNTRYGLDWQLPSIATDSDPLLYHPSNYEFVGWSLDPSASSDKTGQDRQFVYDAGFDGPLDKDDFTMHAIWKQMIGGDEFITVYENDGPVKDDIYTIPYNGTYKFYVASGGGGGAAWWRTHNNSHKEGQGGNGYWGTFTCNLAKGDKVRIPSIGGGGAGDEHHGGNGGTNGGARGGDGGDTEVYVSGKFHVKMTGGKGGHAHGGTWNGDNGKLTMSDGVTVTQERMLRWVLPSSFGIPYAEELSAWAISGIQNNNTKLPTANTSTYKNGKTYKEFWTTYLNTMPNFLDKYKGSANLEYGTPDIFQMVKKYRPGWTKYNSPSDNYKKSPNIISLSITSAKYTDALGTEHAVWPKNSAGKYSCAFAGKQLDEIRDMAITRFGVSSTDGNRGTAAKKYASSGVHGCVKIIVTTIDKCTVTWNGNGGTDPDPTEVENTFAIRTAISVLPTSTRTGYAQNKWWTSAAGGAEVTLDTIVNNSFTAYAHWTPNTYTITWHPNGGVDSIPNWSVTYGTTLGSHGALPIPTREGFEFDNWWTSAAGGTQVTASTSVPAANTTYYAHWTPNSVYYTVTFDLNGGSGTTPAPRTVAAGSSVELPSLASSQYPVGQTFVNWSTSRYTGSGEQHSPYTPTGDITLYAAWEYIQYTITYHANGGTFLHGSSTTTYTSRGQALYTSANISYEGYDFAGWYSNSSLTGVAISEIPAGTTGNKEFWAKWNQQSSSPEPNLLYDGSFYVQDTLHDKHYYYLSPQSGYLESTSLPLRYDYDSSQVVVENMNGKNITLKCTVSGDSCNLKLHVLQPGDQISDTSRLIKSIKNATGEIETTFAFPTDEGKMVLEVEPLNGNEVTIYPFTLTY